MRSPPPRTPKGVRLGGRQKGTPNTLPDLRAMTLKALLQAGGVDYLAQQALSNPGPFLGLLGRVLPREINMEMSGEIRIRQEVRRDLVEKLCVLLTTNVSAPIEHETPAAPLPAITHNQDAMLKAQASQDRAGLSRRAENARREGLTAVSGAVQRAAAMHTERFIAPAPDAERQRAIAAAESGV